MRAIKFRAWVTSTIPGEEGFMLYKVAPFYFVDGDISTADRIYGYRHGEDEPTKVKADIYSFELMQYVGREDKDGRDIYEGDFVRRWTTSRAGVHPNNKHIWLVEYKFTYKYTGFRVAATSTLEVIGNIYENPELLEKAA